MFAVELKIKIKKLQKKMIFLVQKKRSQNLFVPQILLVFLVHTNASRTHRKSLHGVKGLARNRFFAILEKIFGMIFYLVKKRRKRGEKLLKFRGYLLGRRSNQDEIGCLMLKYNSPWSLDCSRRSVARTCRSNPCGSRLCRRAHGNLEVLMWKRGV